MKTVRYFLLLAVTAVVAISCSDSATDPGPTPITVADLVGSWKATSHTFTNNANSSEAFDIVANGGETRMTVLAGGGARTWIVLGDLDDEWDAQLTLSGNTLTSTPVESSRDTLVFTFTLVGDVLTLTLPDVEFDFTLSEGDGVSSRMTLVLVKQ